MSATAAAIIPPKPPKSIADRVPVMLLPLPAVMTITGYSKVHIWRMVKAGKFPEPIHLGRAVRWRVSDLEKFLGEPIPTISD